MVAKVELMKLPDGSLFPNVHITTRTHADFWIKVPSGQMEGWITDNRPRFKLKGSNGISYFFDLVDLNEWIDGFLLAHHYLSIEYKKRGWKLPNEKGIDGEEVWEIPGSEEDNRS